MKFCTGVGIHDIIMYTKFGEDRLRGLCVAMGQISLFSIDWHGRSLVFFTTLQYYRANG